MNDRLHAKVEAVNRANAAANRLSQEMMEFFAPYVGQVILKVDGGLKKSIADKMPVLPNGTMVRAYRHSSNYNLMFNISAHAPIGDPNGPHTVTYHEVSVYIGELDGATLKKLYEPHNFRCDYTAEEVKRKRDTVKAAKKVLSDAESELHPFGEYDA